MNWGRDATVVEGHPQYSLLNNNGSRIRGLSCSIAMKGDCEAERDIEDGIMGGVDAGTWGGVDSRGWCELGRGETLDGFVE